MNEEARFPVLPEVRGPEARGRGQAVQLHDPRGDRLHGEAAGGTGEVPGALNFRELMRIFGKWRWLILGVVALTTIAAVIITLSTPKMYAATAEVEVALQEVNPAAEKGSDIAPRDPQFLGTQLGLLRSRDLSERVARNLSGASRARLVGTGLPPGAQIDAATGAIAGGLTVSGVPLSRLITISYQSPDPGLAAEVANLTADQYIASNVERKYQASAFARRFLQQRIAATKTALENSERALVAYADQQKIVLVGGGENDKGQPTSGQPLDAATLVALNTSLAAAQNDRIVAEQKMRASSSASRSEAINNGSVQSLKAERSRLLVDYQDKLNTYKPDYPEMVTLQSRIRELSTQISRAEGEISGSVSNVFAGEYQAAVGRENQLKARVEQLKSGVMDVRNRQIQYNILARDVDTNRASYDGLLQRFKDVSVSGALGSSLVSVVDRAIVPGAPFKPNLKSNLLAAIVLGLFLGAGLAFIIEFIDDTIKNPDDVKQRLNLTLLGVVPAMPKGERVLDALEDATSAQSEAYLSIRTAIQFTTAGGAPRSLVVTSSEASEGKSSSCFAIARGFARMGKTVLLIDADMRKPSFTVPAEFEGGGLSSLLASNDDLSRHLTRTMQTNLSVLPSGPIPPNPVELLAGTRLRDVLREAEAMFDVVIFDSPPIMGLADATILSSVCDACIFVIEAGRIRRPTAIRALLRLQQADARVIGGVMTKFNLKGASYGYGYGYGYGYKYGQEQKTQRVAKGESRRQITLTRE